MTSAPKINVLPKLIVDQIAAGEVVERPASVVRELLDNAIDAGASKIEIELEAGGRGFIKISDDGHGIGYKDLSLAFASHATSKLSSIEDLLQIASLGFRGEALASIGSIARVKIRSFAEGERHGGEIDNEGGMVTSPRPAARARGTDVEVRDLFYNVPARRRFLRRDATEIGHAVDVALHHALAHPEIEFRITTDGKLQYHFPSAGSLTSEKESLEARRGRIRTAFGAAVADDLYNISSRGSTVTWNGFVGGAASARNDASGVHFFLNGRFIKDRGASRVLRDATRDFFGSKQPYAFLFLTIDPSLVDVNVHPAKLEVRFREPSAVYGLLHQAVRRALESARPAASPESLILQNAARPLIQYTPRESIPTTNQSAGFETRESSLFVAEPPPLLIPRAARFLRAFDTFLVLESPEGIDIVDQHALHERVNFEILKDRVRGGDAPRQTLLIPEIVKIDHEESGLIEECNDLWRRAGLDVALHGPTSAAIRSTPLGLKYISPPNLLRELLALAKNNKTPGAESLLEEVLHRCACHASVKAGDSLSDDEIQYLLKTASALPVEQTCPHGRPTRIRFTLRDLERAFERK